MKTFLSENKKQLLLPIFISLAFWLSLPFNNQIGYTIGDFIYILQLLVAGLFIPIYTVIFSAVHILKRNEKLSAVWSASIMLVVLCFFIVVIPGAFITPDSTLAVMAYMLFVFIVILPILPASLIIVIIGNVIITIIKLTKKQG